MHFHFTSYSSILLIFFSQGIVFSFLILKKGILNREKSNIWLSLFIFLCSLYIVPWMLGFAGWYGLKPYRDIVFYFPFQQLLLIGPTIFFYTKIFLNPCFRFHKKEYLHFLPSLLYILYRFIIFLADVVILRKYFFYADGKDRSLDTWYQVAGVASMSIYLLASLHYYYGFKKFIYRLLNFEDSLIYNWIKQFLFVFFLMQAARVVFLFLYPDWDNFNANWWYFFIFSVLFYYIAISSYAKNIKAILPGHIAIFKDNELILQYNSFRGSISFVNKRIYIDKKEETKTSERELDQSLELLKTELLYLVEKEEIYTNPELSLPVLAKRLNANVNSVSKLINVAYKLNFNDFVNMLRVEAIKKRLLKNEHQKQTLLSIAYECGFNSKPTFNRAFKKFTSFTPKEYIAFILPADMPN